MKNPKICKWPLKIATPVNNKTAPPVFVTTDIYFLKLLEKSRNFSIKIPDIIKGIAKPNE